MISANEFRRKAMEQGFSASDVEKYLKQQYTQQSQTLDLQSDQLGIQQQQLNIQETQQGLSGTDPEKQALQELLESGQVPLTEDVALKYPVIAERILSKGGKIQIQPKEEDLTAEEKKQILNSESGMRALSKIEGILDTDLSKEGLEGKSQIWKSRLPFGLGARSYRSATKEIMDVLTRLRTGAALNEDEFKFYRSQLPDIGDKDEDIKYKLSIFRQLFESFSPKGERPPLSSFNY